MDLKSENEGWLERWQEGRTGFHNETFNPHLLEHWPSLGLAAGSRVFVPMCGKSRDLLWLAEQGHDVVGIELSSKAVAAFFDEAGLKPRRRQSGPFEAWFHGPITIYCGDFFSLDATIVGRLDACYDRAALVALPQWLRERYMIRLTALLPPGTPVLLVTVCYPPDEMSGPPFPVSIEEIRRLSAGVFRVTVLLAGCDMLADNPRFAERGLTRMEECICRLDRLADASVDGAGSG